MIRTAFIAACALAISVAPAQAAMCGDSIGAAVSSSLQNILEARRPQVEAEFKKALGAGDLLANGYTLYNINVRLGQPSFSYQNGQISWRITNNHIYAKSTTPNVLGSYADPAVEINFDLLASGAMRISPDGPPRAEWVTGQVTRATISPRNVSGAVATTMMRAIQITGPGGRAIQQAADKYLVHDLTTIINEGIDAAGFPQTRSTPVSGQAQATRFTAPTYNCGGEVIRADWCAAWGRDCGEPAANAFCTSRGFRASSHFEAQPAARRTYVPRDRRICEGQGCVSFRSITCSNSPPLTDAHVRDRKLREGTASSIVTPKR